MVIIKTFQKKQQKGVDKFNPLCYNIDTVKTKELVRMTVKELKDFLNKIMDEDTQIFVRNDEGFFEVAENAYVDHEGDILITN